ncbi:MAG TPA: hypothetical protein VHM88_02055, partial [Candidatus Acidoferrales bacterium]|nr:hypothetical protein [Candidatus Acidoferrales bacterium]
MSTGNGNGRTTVEIAEGAPTPPPLESRGVYELREAKRRRSLAIALVLFGLTLISTLAAGIEFAQAYANNHGPTFEDFLGGYGAIFTDPKLLLAGIP